VGSEACTAAAAGHAGSEACTAAAAAGVAIYKGSFAAKDAEYPSLPTAPACTAGTPGAEPGGQATAGAADNADNCNMQLQDAAGAWQQQ